MPEKVSPFAKVVCRLHFTNGEKISVFAVKKSARAPLAFILIIDQCSFKKTLLHY